MNPLRSRSMDSERVSGEWGEPARTTTSVLEPFFARFALLLALSDLLDRQMMKAPVPTKATTAAVMARCSEIQTRDTSR